MCTVAAAAIGMGVLQTGAGIMQANAQYKAAHQQAQRQNQIAQQNYNNQLRVAHQNDAAKKKHHQLQLEANQAAIDAAQHQERMNQVEANRANAKITLEKQTVAAEAAFKSQENLSAMIQNQGTMLSTGNVGQSFMLATEQYAKEFGMAQANIDQVLTNQNLGFALDRQGVALDQYSADAQAYNRIPGTPQSQQASLLPYKPIKVKGPGRGALMAGYVGAVASGIGAGLSTGSALSGGAPIGEWGGQNLSDIRAKTNVTLVGQSPSGINIYEFNYRGDSTKFRGALAQDVQEKKPSAVKPFSNGYLGVDYSQLDVTMELVR